MRSKPRKWDSPTAAHEAIATTVSDCLFYQVDMLAGDVNMTLYRATGRKQVSMDIRGGMYQPILDYFAEAWSESPPSVHLCCPKVQHVSANSLYILKQ